MAFICGNCKNKHRDAADGRACYAGKTVPVVGPCTWLVARPYLDFDYIEQTTETECGAEAVYTERGFTCAAGHSHVNAEFRVQEGWDYAHDEEEAYVLAYYGTVPMRMDGAGVSETRRPAHFAD